MISKDGALHDYVYDLSQNPASGHCHMSAICPAMLRGSQFWSSKRKRIFTTAEMFLVQGILIMEHLRGPGRAWCPIASELSALSNAEVGQLKTV